MGATISTPTRRERSRGSIRVRRWPGRPTTAPLGAGVARWVTTTAARARTTARACRTTPGRRRRRPSRSQISLTASYWGTCAPCTLTAGAVPRRTTFTEAGGYAPVGKTVGVVTVRNLRTGQSGRTAALGSGIRRGALSPQVTVEAGDSYRITHTGTVYKQEADAYLVSDPRPRLRRRSRSQPPATAPTAPSYSLYPIPTRCRSAGDAPAPAHPSCPSPLRTASFARRHPRSAGAEWSGG